MEKPDGDVAPWLARRSSLSQGQRRMFAGNEGHYACLSPAPATGPLRPTPDSRRPRSYSPGHAARRRTPFLQVPPSWPWSGLARPAVLWPLARTRENGLVRRGFGAMRRFLPRPMRWSRWGSEWLGSPPTVPRPRADQRKLTRTVFGKRPFFFCNGRSAAAVTVLGRRPPGRKGHFPPFPKEATGLSTL